MNFNSFSYILSIITIVLIFSLCIFIPCLSEYGNISTYTPRNTYSSIDISYSSFVWPTPGYTTITSPFGARKSPITGKESFHYGTDIGVPQGTNIIAICSGKVAFTGFKGANGYTVTITNGNLDISYSHVSPLFLVYVGQYVSQGEIIAKVGPKNVYNVSNNPYRDSSGNPTNRIYNRSSLTFKHKRKTVMPSIL